MTEPGKRPFWQLHLSTAMLLVILVGVLLGLDIETLQILKKVYGQATLHMLIRDSYALAAVTIEVGMIVFVIVAFEWEIRRKAKH